MDYQNQNMGMNENTLDDEFEMFAKEIEQELSQGGKRSSQRTKQIGEEIKYTGLVKGEMKIIRVLGGVPNRDGVISNMDPYTARVVRIASIRNDNGKFVKIVIPNRETDPNHIFWRIINKVFEVDFEETKKRKKKVYIIERKAPEVFELITKNGIPSNSMKRFGLEGKGWLGKDYLLMNCIDRDPSIYKWSRENKHTVVLSKSVNVYTVPSTNNDSEPLTIIYAEPGVPAFSFLTILSTNVFKYYGNWNRYDIGVEKTGLIQPAFRIINASKHKEEVPKTMRPYVVDGPLTPEELSWEKYNFNEIFKPVSESFFFYQFKNTIKRLDVGLNTQFYEELSEKVLGFKDMEEEDNKSNVVVDNVKDKNPDLNVGYTDSSYKTIGRSSLSSKDLDDIFGVGGKSPKIVVNRESSTKSDDFDIF